MDDMGIGTREAAQGLVEFALVVVLLMAVIAGMVDIAPLIFNAFTAKQMSARGARAASIYLPDGARICVGDVVNAVGTPALIGATWSLEEVSPNCTTNPLSTIPTGQMVSVKVRVDYVPLFWGGAGFPRPGLSARLDFRDANCGSGEMRGPAYRPGIKI